MIGSGIVRMDEGTFLVRKREFSVNPEYYCGGRWRILPHYAHSDVQWFKSEEVAA